MITHISFDLDGTLITGDFDNMFWNEELPQRMAKQHRIPLALAKEHTYAEYYKALYIERIENWTSVDYWCERLHIDRPTTLTHLHRHIKLYDEAIPALETASQEYTVILFTANDDTLLNVKIDATGLSKYFSHVISAPTRYGSWKRDSNAFKRFLRDLHINADELLHIGDNPTHDYDAPRRLGINAQLIDRKNKTPGSIKTLLEIRKPVAAPVVL